MQPLIIVLNDERVTKVREQNGAEPRLWASLGKGFDVRQYQKKTEIGGRQSGLERPSEVGGEKRRWDVNALKTACLTTAWPFEWRHGLALYPAWVARGVVAMEKVHCYI